VTRSTRERFGITALIAFTWLMASGSALAAPAVSAPVFADVTDRSFSVIWTADEAVEGSVRVFTDPDGLGEITGGVEIVEESAAYPPARDLGVVRVRVLDVPPATTLYLQRITTSRATRELVSTPALPPYDAVTTAASLARRDADQRPLINDQLALSISLADAGDPSGVIVLLTAAGAAHPVSAFVGEQITAPMVLLDLNDLIDATTASSWIQGESTALGLTALGGSRGLATGDSVLGAASGRGALQRLSEPALVLAPDFDSDGDGIADDGDGSRIAGDAPCAAGATSACDDNCPASPNADQADGNGNGVGDVCE
jgi:hypothetical protein